jgi:KDO2-lipid IV(A) lauroyltransferase
MPRLLLSLAARIPLPILHALGGLLGWAIYGLSPTYRRHLRENLAAAGYGGDAATRRAAIAGAGRMVAEMPAVWLRPRAEAAALVRRIEGREHVDAARAAGKGIVFFTPHLGCFEIAARAAAGEFPITVLYRPPKYRWLQELAEHGRAGDNLRIASADLAGVRALMQALARGEAIGILPDQVPGTGEGAWTEFFGKPAYTMTFGGRLVDRAGNVCLLAFGERLPRGEGYALRIRPLPPALPGEGGMRRLNRGLEQLIREHPGQYLWGYNRYKRPAGAPGSGASSGAPAQ